MPSRLSVRYYSVKKSQRNGPSFQHALEQIHGQDRADRRIQLAAGYVVRLERYEVDAGDLAGEFIRVRDTDFPFEVTDDGVRGLPVDGPIGMGIAFRFRPADHTLAIQYDTRIVSPGRLVDYMKLADERFAFSITPKLDRENWRKFNENPVRKIRIGIASPQNLADIEDEGEAVRASFERLGEAYNGQVITIEIGMGQRKGALNAAARTVTAAFAKMFRGGDADLRSLKGWVKPEGDGPTEELNLIDEFLSDKIQFPSPRNDPEENYRVRRDIMKQSLRAHA